jgi:hypothetical protein
MTGALETFKMGICATWTLGKKLCIINITLTMDAFEPFRVLAQKQDPSPLPYLQQKGKHHLISI